MEFPLVAFIFRWHLRKNTKGAVVVIAGALIRLKEMIMRNLIWVVLAAVVLVGGYMLFTGKSVTEAVDSVSGTADEIEAPTALEEAGEAMGEATEQAADAVSDTASEAAEAASDAVEAATDTAGEAADAAADTAGEAADAASEAATEAAEATDGAGNDAAAAAQTPEALTVEGFDMDEARRLIREANLGAMQENLLIEGIQAVEDNPDLLRPALEAAQRALGY